MFFRLFFRIDAVLVAVFCDAPLAPSKGVKKTAAFIMKAAVICERAYKRNEIEVRRYKRNVLSV